MNTQQDSVAVLRELIDAADELASAEKAYRHAHDHFGDGHIEAGRAWDRMRKAGIEASNKVTHARALQSQQGASADRGEAVPFGHHFRDMEGRQHFHTGAQPPCFAQSDITPLYTTPPSPAESAEGSLTYAQQRKVVEHMTTELRAAIPMLQSVLQRAEAIDCQPLAAAPSGVSDADAHRAMLAYHAAFDSDPNMREDDAMRAALESYSQPQPGRVEGMVLVPRGKLLSWRDVIDIAPSQVQAEITDALATASSQEPDHG